MAGVSRQSHYDWLRDDPSYAAKFDEADDLAADRMEAVLFEEAVKTRNPTLLIFINKALKPAKYRDNYRVEMSGPNGRPIETQTTLTEREYVQTLTDDELRQIVAEGIVSGEIERPTPPIALNRQLRISAPLPLDQSDGAS
jgi:hypothetical protein